MASIFGEGGGARTDFPGDTMRTRVSAGDQLSAFGGGDGFDPYAIIKKLKADKERQRREAAEFDLDLARSEARKDTMLSGEGDPLRNLRVAAEREGLQANIAQSKTASAPPPTRMMFGPGVIPGPTLDVMSMSGAQRHAYLPQDAVAPDKKGLLSSGQQHSALSRIPERDPWGDPINAAGLL